MSAAPVSYVGFWARSGAFLVDSLWVLLLLAPLAALLGVTHAGSLEALLADPQALSPRALLVTELLPAVLVLAFWMRKYATPGKMLIGARIADAATLGDPSRRQLLLRYLGYYVSTLPLGLGLLWVAFDARKRGWHDWIAGTVVVRARRPA